MKKFLLLGIFFSIVQFASAQPTSDFVDDAPYNYEEVEVRPEFPGGYSEFMKFIGKNFVMPDYDGNGGSIKISFIIELSGVISNVVIIKDLGSGTGAEGKRVISMSPPWIPGELRGKKVRVIYELPIKIANQN